VQDMSGMKVKTILLLKNIHHQCCVLAFVGSGSDLFQTLAPAPRAKHSTGQEALKI